MIPTSRSAPPVPPVVPPVLLIPKYATAVSPGPLNLALLALDVTQLVLHALAVLSVNVLLAL